MSPKKPPKGKRKKPEADEQAPPATEEKIGPLEELLIERAEAGLLFPGNDDEFMKMFNDALRQIFAPEGGVDLEEWGKDGPHTMH